MQEKGPKALKSLLYYLALKKKTLLTHSLVEMTREGGKKNISGEALKADGKIFRLFKNIFSQWKKMKFS